MVDVIVIGGGPAGLTAAWEAARAGAAVTLVSAEPIGGRANWHSLLPSKVLLTAADHLGEAAHNPALGLAGPAPAPDLPALRARIAALAEARSHHERMRLEHAGVTIVSGRARFLDATHVEIAGEEGAETLGFDRAIIATGSVPTFPPGIRPDGQRILAPRLAGKLAAWPDHVIVIGGGVTGAEFAYFFNRMGPRVTWVTDLWRMLPRSDPDLAGALETTLAARGTTLLHNAPVVSVEAETEGVRVTLEDGRTLAGSHAFLALGRRPDVDDLDLDAARIEAAPQGIAVDALGRTSQPHIYAAGDVAGPPYVANRSQAQARVAARHAAGVETTPFRPETVVEAVYTDPQLAQVGLTETAAAEAGGAVRVLRAAYEEGLKPHLAGDAEGLVKIVAAAEGGRILGGGAVGSRAAEVLAPLTVAIAGGLTIDDLAAIFPAYPSLAELVGIAARQT